MSDSAACVKSAAAWQCDTFALLVFHITITTHLHLSKLNPRICVVGFMNDLRLFPKNTQYNVLYQHSSSLFTFLICTSILLFLLILLLSSNLLPIFLLYFYIELPNVSLQPFRPVDQLACLLHLLTNHHALLFSSIHTEFAEQGVKQMSSDRIKYEKLNYSDGLCVD